MIPSRAPAFRDRRDGAPLFQQTGQAHRLAVQARQLPARPAEPAVVFRQLPPAVRLAPRHRPHPPDTPLPREQHPALVQLAAHAPAAGLAAPPPQTVHVAADHRRTPGKHLDLPRDLPADTDKLLSQSGCVHEICMPYIIMTYRLQAWKPAEELFF